ncbi:energy-coupling factor transporter transmembrane component T [Lolliginicoccus suaedae]|uniref:energy-coupling factor transporter transmembrane component T n=1 Tax=Lolliginicoccus suaedae TaxID=2605429 RepID=UPI0016595EEE|nr:energy-coupling factor transporter transmembrane component T [Lolliginicoccus suaedae]
MDEPGPSDDPRDAEDLAWARRRHPVLLLVGFLCLLVLVFVTPIWWWLLPGMIVLVVLLARCGRAGTWLALAAPFAVLAFLLQGMFYPEGVTELASLGPARVTTEGLEFAALLSLRIGTSLALFLVLGAAVTPARMMPALTSVGMSPRVSYIVMSSITLVPELRAHATTVLDAQRARGLRTRGGPVHRLRIIAGVALPVVLRIIADSGEKAFMLEQRGFGAARRPTTYRSLEFPQWERLACVVLVLLTVTLAIVLVAG